MSGTPTSNTRRRRAPVLAVLQTADKPLTVGEIADGAACSLVTVRRHLKALLTSGQVHNAGRRPRLRQDGRRRAGHGRHLYTASPAR